MFQMILIEIDFLDRISENFEKFYLLNPYLYDYNTVNHRVKLKNNEKLIYLPNNDRIINNTVFLGYCGWWDYNNSE